MERRADGGPEGSDPDDGRREDGLPEDSHRPDGDRLEGDRPAHDRPDGDRLESDRPNADPDGAGDDDLAPEAGAAADGPPGEAAGAGGDEAGHRTVGSGIFSSGPTAGGAPAGTRKRAVSGDLRAAGWAVAAIVVATLSIFLAQRLHPNLTGQRDPGRPNPTARHAVPPPSERPGCVASFAVSSTWQSGFRATVTVRATGAAAIDGWTVTWTFPGDQAVMQMWNGQYTQTHSKVTVQSEGWNGSPSPKGAARFGFIASGDTPTAVQDLACTVSLATASPSRR